MNRIGIKHSKDGGPLTWRMEEDIQGHAPALTCSMGHSSILRTHRIVTNGEVMPSCGCPVEGCTFHEYVTLEGWKEHAR